jgi:hypothetical protein
MKAVLRFMIGICVYLHVTGCNIQNRKSISTRNADSTSDTIKSRYQKIDTTTLNSENLPEILQNYIETYRNKINVDTSFDYAGERLRIVFKYYCTYDSSLRLPGKYVGVYGLKEFVTHSFKSILTIRLGERLVIDTVIDKNVFEDNLFEEEKLYGALLYPNLSFSKQAVKIDYSISVPLTDVGVGVSLECSFDGKLIVDKI